MPQIYFATLSTVPQNCYTSTKNSLFHVFSVPLSKLLHLFHLFSIFVKNFEPFQKFTTFCVISVPSSKLLYLSKNALLFHLFSIDSSKLLHISKNSPEHIEGGHYTVLQCTNLWNWIPVFHSMIFVATWEGPEGPRHKCWIHKWL